MAAVPTVQGSAALVTDTRLAPVIGIEALRATVAGQLLERRHEQAVLTAELTSHHRRGAAHAHERLTALEDSIARLAPDLAEPDAWADADSGLLHAPGQATGWCRLCQTSSQVAA